MIEDPGFVEFIEGVKKRHLNNFVCIHVLQVAGPLQPESYVEAFVGLLVSVDTYAFVLRHLRNPQIKDSEDTYSTVITQHIVAIADVNMHRGQTEDAAPKEDPKKPVPPKGCCTPKIPSPPRKPKVTKFDS